MSPRPAPLDLDAAVRGVRAAEPAWVARAITLVESTRPDHRAAAQELLTRLGAGGEGVVRVGISGVPGAGKSTLVDALGTRLTANGRRVAVLAVDPSSTRTRGSILGDRTRMPRLAADPAAFVRPSPSAGTLGGVARATREAMVVVEAAGYDVVLVETVGVGQSETAVAGMVDTFVLLTLARTGDGLQGMKKGVLELADLVAVNKADGDGVVEARRAARELAAALRLLGARTPVLTCSALEGSGLDDLWAAVLERHTAMVDDGRLASRRRDQAVGWTWELVREGLLARLRESPAVAELAPQIERQVTAGALTPGRAAERLLAALDTERP